MFGRLMSGAGEYPRSLFPRMADDMHHIHQPAAFASYQSGSSRTLSLFSAAHLPSHFRRAIRS